MSQPPSRTRALAVGATVLAPVGLGWFLLSHLVMDNPVGDALGETLGVILGVLVLLAIIGTIVTNSRRKSGLPPR